MKRLFAFSVLHVSGLALFGQSIKLPGRIVSQTEVENIHVINKTQQVFSISDKNGLFTIVAKLNDTISFSSVQHKSKEVVVTKSIMALKVIYVSLEEQVNELNEVLVGKVLTGDLLSDIENVEGEVPINFYDVGIPGFTGKIATQSERRLAQAGEFKPSMLLGLVGGGLPLDPILNGISGRTKMLKNRVDTEEREGLMHRIISRLAKDFFVSNPLEDDLKMDFFYFCSDDENFLKYCRDKTDFEVLIFLRMKYKQYLKNRNSIEN